MSGLGYNSMFQIKLDNIRKLAKEFSKNQLEHPGRINWLYGIYNKVHFTIIC